MENIEATFSIEKIRKDLHDYLDIGNDTSFDLISGEEFSGLEKQILYHVNDPITLIAIKVTKKYHGIVYFPYQLEIGLGKFKIEVNSSIYKVEKCLAEMFYDDDFNLITIDFFHRN
jgi:hypothetical protein